MRVGQRFTAHRGLVIADLGIAQILSWGSTFYLLTVLAHPIAVDTGWHSGLVVGGISIALAIAGIGSPRIGVLVARDHGRSVLIFCSWGALITLCGRSPYSGRHITRASWVASAWLRWPRS
ncbi:MAG: hypothetical protein ACTIJ6_11360 [Leucobacter sp.]